MQVSFIVSTIVVLLVINSVDDCSTSDPISSLKSLVAKKEVTTPEFDSIDQFKDFVEEAKKKDSKWLHANDAEAILELDSILTTHEVCSPSKIDELVEYHKKYLTQNKIFKRKKPVVHKFFTQYAIQIAYTCKKSLIRNLETARQELQDRSKVFEEATEKVYNEEPSIKSNIKLIEEQLDSPVSSNVKPKDEVELSFGEYREALTQLRQPEDILTFDRDDCLQSRHREIKVSTDKLQTFFKPALMCQQLHRYYAGSLLSIAKLANIGYAAYNEELDSKLLSNPMLKDWIVAVQVCEPMMYMYAKEVVGEWSIVDTCAPKVTAIETVIYEDNLEILNLNQLKDMVSKSVASRAHAQKLMKTALRKIARTNLLKQAQSATKKKGIFSKSLAMLTAQYVSSSFTPEAAITAKSMQQFSFHLTRDFNSNIMPNFSHSELSEKESYDVLMKIVNMDKKCLKNESGLERNEETDSAVSFFDPLSMLVSTMTLLVIMMSFEWLFFIVMSLAGRLCHRLYFNFDNILTFPPKFLSWGDADFAKFNNMVDNVDEDDFFDYDELSPDEQQQRKLLEKVFGRPPPLMYKD